MLHSYHNVLITSSYYLITYHRNHYVPTYLSTLAVHEER